MSAFYIKVLSYKHLNQIAFLLGSRFALFEFGLDVGAVCADLRGDALDLVGREIASTAVAEEIACDVAHHLFGEAHIGKGSPHTTARLLSITNRRLLWSVVLFGFFWGRAWVVEQILWARETPNKREQDPPKRQPIRACGNVRSTRPKPRSRPSKRFGGMGDARFGGRLRSQRCDGQKPRK